MGFLDLWLAGAGEPEPKGPLSRTPEPTLLGGRLLVGSRLLSLLTPQKAAEFTSQPPQQAANLSSAALGQSGPAQISPPGTLPGSSDPRASPGTKLF